MKPLITFCYILFAITLCSCPAKKGIVDSIYFTNNSNQTNLIVFCRSQYYWDSVLPSVKPTADGVFRDAIPNKKLGLFISYDGGVLNSISASPQKAFTFYLFDKNVLNNNTWNDIKSNNMYIKKYVITTSQVNNESNLEITYP
jgi:hypothetical protein